MPNTRSTIIVTESADLDAASDFISRAVHEPNQIRSILLQASVEAKFLQLLEVKVKPVGDIEVARQLAAFGSKGFPLINGAIVRCPHNLIAADASIANLEVFRTTKEAVSFGKCSLSVGLWCENLSITFEYVNLLANARQIWLNSTHGLTHPQIPFYNGQIVCEDADIKSRAVGDIPGSTIQVTGHVRFVATFRSNTFQTVVIPFGETFAN